MKGNIKIDLQQHNTTFDAKLNSPHDTTAIIGIPKSLGNVDEVRINDELVWHDGKTHRSTLSVEYVGEDAKFLSSASPPATGRSRPPLGNNAAGPGRVVCGRMGVGALHLFRGRTDIEPALRDLSRDTMSDTPLRIGLFGIGLDTYWPQFEGLKERLEGYLGTVAGKLARPGVEIVNVGLVDNPERAYEAGRELRRADVDLIFLHVTTYALSSTVLPVVRRAKVPVIVLNLAPEPAIDYARFNALGDRTKMTGEWLAHCSACPVPEIANVFQRAGHPLSPGHRRAGRRSGVLERDRRLGGGRAGGGGDGGEPARPDGPLLQRHAGHLLRRDPAVRGLRHPHRDPRGGRAGGPSTRGRRGGGRGAGRGVPRGLRRPGGLPGRGPGGGGADRGGARCDGRGPSSRLDGLLLQGHRA